jgi:peroxiredoxin
MAEERSVEPTKSEPEKPPLRRRVRRWVLEIAVVLGVYLAVSAWRERDMPETSDPAPPFTLTSLDGRHVSLADLAGKTVLLHFWATWCGVCKLEIPTLDSIHDGLDEDEVLLAVVASNDAAEVRRFASEHALEYPILMASGDILSAYGISAFPTNFIIDPEGRIQHKSVGMSTRLGLGTRMSCAGH